MTGSVLSPGVACLVLFGGFFFLMFMRVPIAFALGLSCVPILFIEPRLDSMMLMQETFNAYNSFILLAVPFFLLTANLMNAGGTTNRLLGLSRTMVGHFPGGLAQINVLLSIFFAGISGSATADAASQSKIFLDAQRKEGYDDSFSVSITAVSAVLSNIFPPSILMVVWGGLLTVSIGALFLAGIIPGLLVGLAQMATVHAYAKARGYPTYVRSGYAALRAYTFDRMLGCRHTHEGGPVGHEPHAPPNAGSVGAPHHLAGNITVPAAADLARIPEIDRSDLGHLNMADAMIGFLVWPAF